MNRARVWTNSFTMAEHVQSAKHDLCRELGRQRLCRNVTVSIKFVASTRWKFGIRWIEKTQSDYRTSHVMGHVSTKEHARQDMTAIETSSTLRQFWLKHFDAMEVLIMDQVHRVLMLTFNTCANPVGILPVVTDLETPWQNSVIERHGALFKMAFEKACSPEAPTTEAEVNELIDFTVAELNRRVGLAGFSPGQRVLGRQLRLQSSLLEDDFIDPYMIAQDATHEMRRSEAMQMAAAHGCVVAADRRAMSTASHSRQRKPQRDWWLENQSSYTDGRMEPMDGADLACAS